MDIVNNPNDYPVFTVDVHRVPLNEIYISTVYKMKVFTQATSMITSPFESVILWL